MTAPSRQDALERLVAELEALTRRTSWPLRMDLACEATILSVASDHARTFHDLADFVLPHLELAPPGADAAAGWAIYVSATRLPTSVLESAGRPHLLAHSTGNRPLVGSTLEHAGWQLVLNTRSGALIAAETRSRRMVIAAPPPMSLRPSRVSDLSIDAHSAIRLLVRQLLHQRSLVVLHGSAVTEGAETLVVLGGKGSGKTTAQLALLTAGELDYVAGDRCFVSLAADGSLGVYGWPSTFRPSLATASLYPPTRSQLSWEQYQAALAGGTAAEEKLDWTPSEVAHRLALDYSPRGRLTGILFSCYDPGEYGYEVHAIEAGEVPSRIAEHVFPELDPSYPDWLDLVAREAGSGSEKVRESLERTPAARLVGCGDPDELAAAVLSWWHGGDVAEGGCS